MTSERAAEPGETEELRLGQLICEGSNHDHEWAVCRASETVALYLLPRLAAAREEPGLDVERLLSALHGAGVPSQVGLARAVAAEYERLAPE